MNKVTRTLSESEMNSILTTIRDGFNYNGICHRGSLEVCFALYLESVCGCRIGDIVNLTLQNFKKQGSETHIVIKEQKTQKHRDFFISEEVYSSILDYCLSHNRKKDERIIKIGVRQIQKLLQAACGYLGYSDVGTHSFRKTLATSLYQIDHDLLLVQLFLQHSSPNVTRRYINVGHDAIRTALLQTSRAFEL